MTKKKLQIPWPLGLYTYFDGERYCVAGFNGLGLDGKNKRNRKFFNSLNAKVCQELGDSLVAFNDGTTEGSAISGMTDDERLMYLALAVQAVGYDVEVVPA